jgi:hypothetical protein
VRTVENLANSLSRSSSDNGRTKIRVFMGVTVTHHPKPILTLQ